MIVWSVSGSESRSFISLSLGFAVCVSDIVGCVGYVGCAVGCVGCAVGCVGCVGCVGGGSGILSYCDLTVPWDLVLCG